MLYILYGTVNYLIENEIQKIVEQHKLNCINIIKYNLNNDLLTTILNDASSISLFGEKKIIIVSNSYIFTGNVKKGVEQNIEELEKYFNSMNPNTILIFTTNSEKLDERKKITKLAKKLGIVKDYNQADTVAIVQKMFDDYSIQQENIKFLINRVGDNITLLSNEIEKIKLYKDQDKNITKKNIEELTSKALEINNFKLIDSIISKNKSEAISLYNERLKLNEEPIAIIIALANQIRIMYQVKQLYLDGYSENKIASILCIHPYRIKLAAQNAKRYDSNILLEYLKQLSDLDINIKTGKIEKELGLELFILSV